MAAFDDALNQQNPQIPIPIPDRNRMAFLEGLLEFNGPVDLLGGSWECECKDAWCDRDRQANTQSTRWEMVVLGVVKYMSC